MSPTHSLTSRSPLATVPRTFFAATNFHPNACWDMATALQHGIGLSTNLIEAYAWLQLFADSSTGWAVGRVQLNELALKLDTQSLAKAQKLARQHSRLDHLMNHQLWFYEDPGGTSCRTTTHCYPPLASVAKR